MATLEEGPLKKFRSAPLAQPATGVELLEYELIVDGIPKELMDGHENGAYHVRQAIDHLLKRIAEEPIEVPPQPAKPNKASGDNRRK